MQYIISMASVLYVDNKLKINLGISFVKYILIFMNSCKWKISKRHLSFDKSHTFIYTMNYYFKEYNYITLRLF